jgi:hypothetical protein
MQQPALKDEAEAKAKLHILVEGDEIAHLVGAGAAQMGKPRGPRVLSRHGIARKTSTQYV